MKNNNHKSVITAKDIMIAAAEAHVKISKKLKEEPSPLSIETLKKYGIDPDKL
jgi:hypothetical protein